MKYDKVKSEDFDEVLNEEDTNEPLKYKSKPFTGISVYEDANEQRETYFNNGFTTGKSKIFLKESKTVFYRSEFDSNNLSKREVYQNSIKLSECYYKLNLNGKETKDGPEKLYYPNGQFWKEVIYVDGKIKDGVYRVFDKSGNEYTCTYINGTITSTTEPTNDFKNYLQNVAKDFIKQEVDLDNIDEGAKENLHFYLSFIKDENKKYIIQNYISQINKIDDFRLEKANQLFYHTKKTIDELSKVFEENGEGTLIDDFKRFYPWEAIKFILLSLRKLNFKNNALDIYLNNILSIKFYFGYLTEKEINDLKKFFSEEITENELDNLFCDFLYRTKWF